MEEKIEEMKEIIAKAISDYLEEEGIIQLHIKGRKDGTSTKIISNAFYKAGYRKESDTAKEICDLILEYWKVDAFVDCSWVIEVISEKYGVDLGE